MRNILITFFTLIIMVSPVAAQDFSKGAAAYKARDYVTVLKEFKPLAEQGHLGAQVNLAFMYTEGDGIPRDYAKAASLWLLAAEQGDSWSQVQLGNMYKKGRGVASDRVIAMMWYNVAYSNLREDPYPGNNLASENLISFYEIPQEEIAKAEAMAKDCVNNNYKNCASLLTNPGHFAKILEAELLTENAKPTESTEWVLVHSAISAEMMSDTTLVVESTMGMFASTDKRNQEVLGLGDYMSDPRVAGFNAHEFVTFWAEGEQDAEVASLKRYERNIQQPDYSFEKADPVSAYMTWLDDSGLRETELLISSAASHEGAYFDETGKFHSKITYVVKLGEGDIPNSDMQFVTLIVAAECVAPGLWGKIMGHNWLCKLQ